MKKTIGLWLLLLLCGLGAMVYVYVSVNRGGEQVTITEQVLEGDPKLAEGITIRIRSKYMDSLTWDTVFQVGQEELAQTEQGFLTEKEKEHRKQQAQMETFQMVGRIWVRPTVANSTSVGTIGDVESYAKENQGVAQLQEILQEAEDLCEPGEDAVKTFWLKEYYTYYPFYATLSDRDVLFGILRQGEVYVPADYNEWESIMSQELQKYFRIPIVEDDRLTVIIEKDAKGMITELSVNSWNGQAEFSSIMTDTGMYFTLGMPPEIYDYSQVPGGYGIYYLPMIEVDGRLCVVPEEMKTVCTLEENCVPEELWDDEAGESLVYLTWEGEPNNSILNVVNMDTMEVVQQLGYGISPEWDSQEPGATTRISNVVLKNGCMVVGFYDNRILLYEKTEQGIYEFQFSSEIYVPEGEMAERMGSTLPFGFTTSDVAYNGKYLTVAGFVPVKNSGLTSCDVYLTLYGAEGVAYYGIYHNSLNSGVNEYYYFHRCEPDGVDALTLQWPE